MLIFHYLFLGVKKKVICPFHCYNNGIIKDSHKMI